MAPAVELDQQLLGHAREVRDIRADGLLTAEFVTVQLFVAQVVPEETLRVGLGLPEGFGVFQGLSGVLVLDLLPSVGPPTGAGI